MDLTSSTPLHSPDAAKEYGASHFLQHLAFKATTKRSSLKILR